MPEFSLLAESVSIVLQPHVIAWLMAGFALGVLVGAVPGLGEGTFLAIVLPFTVYLEPWTAITFMTAIYVAAEVSGAYPSILVNIPGTPGTFATALDGYPLTKQGKAGIAIGVAIMASAAASLMGALIFLLWGGWIAQSALLFGSPEMFMVAVLGIAAVSSLTGEELSKGLLAASFGLLIATTGIDPIAGEQRATFGLIGLYDGIPLLAALLGLFGFSEILENANRKHVRLETPSLIGLSAQIRQGMGATFHHKMALVRSSIIGFLIGIVPGIGAATASLIAYGQGRQWSRKPEDFGRGSIEGIISSEAANNSCIPGSLLPTLALGIPGSGTAVLFIAALQIQGLRPGPGFWESQAVEAHALGISLVIISVVAVFVCYPTASLMARLAYIPRNILIPFLVILIIIGSFIDRNNTFDIYTMMVFGVLGFAFKSAGYPVSALLLGLILGPMLEENLLRSLSLGGISIFFYRPICLGLLLCIVATLTAPFVLARIRANRGAR